MPTTSPEVLSSAPPELPRLIATSVWMNGTYCWPRPPLRPTALTMPAVTEWPRPSRARIAPPQRPGPSPAAHRADDADRDRMVQAHRRADRHHPPARAQRRGAAQTQHRQAIGLLALQFEQGHVIALVAADQLGLQLAPVGQAHGDGL